MKGWLGIHLGPTHGLAPRASPVSPESGTLPVTMPPVSLCVPFSFRPLSLERVWVKVLSD